MHEIVQSNSDSSEESLIEIPEFLAGFNELDQMILDRIDRIVIDNIKNNRAVYVPEIDQLQMKAHEIHIRNKLLSYSERMELRNWHS